MINEMIPFIVVTTYGGRGSTDTRCEGYRITISS